MLFRTDARVLPSRTNPGRESLRYCFDATISASTVQTAKREKTRRSSAALLLYADGEGSVGSKLATPALL